MEDGRFKEGFGVNLMNKKLRGGSVLGLIVLLYSSCVHMPNNVHNVQTTSPSAEVPWTPPAIVPSIHVPPKMLPIPAEQIRKEHLRLSLVDVVDIALQNNPSTHSAWYDARAAAAKYFSSRGARFPTIDLANSLTYSKGATTPGPPGGSQGPTTITLSTAELNYLLFDFGGRSATIEESRQALLAANWTQNSVIQDTLLRVETAFFNNAGVTAQLEANRVSLADAEANLAASEEKHRVGMATGADVLQAKTAYEEAVLAVQEAEGNLRKAKGSLAIAMGYPANTIFYLETQIPEIPHVTLTQSIDELINRAINTRPDLQASRANFLEAKARITEARSRMLPTLSASGQFSRIWTGKTFGVKTPYKMSLSLQIPVFNGFSYQLDILQAKAAADSALEKTRSAEHTASYQVLSSHSDFLTANENVTTTRVLMDSALQSEKVALGRYQEGVGSILDLLSAQKALASARSQQINAQVNWFISLAHLAHDIGILGLHGKNPLISESVFSGTPEVK